MEKKQLEQEVIKLRTQLLLNQQQQQQIRTATMNETLHNVILQKTENITDEVMHDLGRLHLVVGRSVGRGSQVQASQRR